MLSRPLPFQVRAVLAALSLVLGALAACTVGRSPTPVVEVVAPEPAAAEPDSAPSSVEPSPAAVSDPAPPAVTPSPSPSTPSAPRTRAVAEPVPEPHLEGTWLAVRGPGLGLDAAGAAARDEAMAGTPPTGAWWDEALAREAWSLWRGLCYECHGGKRTLAKVLKFPAPSTGWADEDALYFTRLRSPRAMYGTIMNGQRATRPGERDMPSWRRALTHEQAWALVYYVRSASKGRDLR